MLGAETHFLGDGIRRAYESRVSKPPQYGYSQDALIARRQILQAACDVLSNHNSRRDYNLGLSVAFEETTLFEVPFDKVNFRLNTNFDKLVSQRDEFWVKVSNWVLTGL